MATLSFYPAHHITMGEGGAVFTNSIKLKRIAESFRDWGRDCYCEPGKDNTCNKRFGWQLGDLPFGYDHKYTYSHMGYNMKITDMQAACGVAQLTKLNSFISIRKKNFSFLYKNLKNLEEFLILPEAELNSEPSWFGFPLSIKDNKKFNRNKLINFLNESKIGTRLLFSGNLIKQPYMKNKKLTSEEIEKLQEIQQKNAAVATELGNLEITKLQLEARKGDVIKFYNDLKEEEQTFGKELSDKYGNGSIDLEKGEFIPGPAAE